MLRIKLVRSLIGNNPRNRATVAALGLRKMQQTVYLPDNPSVRGMVHHVKHLLEVEAVESAPEVKKSSRPRAAAKKAEPQAKATPRAKPEPKAATEAVAVEAEAKPAPKKPAAPKKAAAKPKAEKKSEPKVK